ncbi:3-dehydroquinate synthase [Kamptonema cortianum]|nr:3-dehydroquinate synthase [Geitlerinema splendidum]MDK3162298.1 3-dehydroquinate synthase [Kamptonema cortianum]
MSQAAVTVSIPNAADSTYEVSFTSLAHAVSQIPNDAAVITDSNLAQLYPDVKDRDRAYVVPAGESSKNGDQFLAIHRFLAEHGLKRNDVLVAFGGGVIGDLAGFVAATYARGIEFIQIPTTLLAMVDSSVGGKVGIDLPEAKNMVGAFHHPSQVLIPLDVLQTLPKAEFANGCAEILKYGLIYDPELWHSLEKEPLTLDSSRLQQVVARCIQIKAEIVQNDPLEKTGLRAILNFGHTVGHALEQCSNFAVPHGSAVALGMIAEIELAHELGVAQDVDSAAVSRVIGAHDLPTMPSHQFLWANLLAAMRRDKKGTGNGLAFSLVESVGRCKLVTGVPEEAVRAVLTKLWQLPA